MQDLHGLAVGDFRVLCAVADAGSISAAAASLGYTQSGVSRRIAAIERATGTALLVRLPRGIRLTHAGERLRSRALELLQTVARAERDLAIATGGRRLRVGVFSTANSTVMPRVLARLAATDPGLRVAVREQRSTALVRGLTAGTLDIAIVSDYPAALPPSTGVELEGIADDPVVVALPTRHALAGRRLSFLDLASARWVEGDPSETPVLLTAASRAGFEPDVAFRVRDWHTKLAYVAAGVGVALVPGLAAASNPDGVVFHEVDGLPSRTVSFAVAAHVAADPTIDLLRSVARQVTRTVTSRALTA